MNLIEIYCILSLQFYPYYTILALCVLTIMSATILSGHRGLSSSGFDQSLSQVVSKMVILYWGLSHCLGT